MRSRHLIFLPGIIFVAVAAAMVLTPEGRTPEPAFCVNADGKAVDDEHCERADRLRDREGILSSRYRWYFGGVGSPGAIVWGGSYLPVERGLYETPGGKRLHGPDCERRRHPRRRPDPRCVVIEKARAAVER